MNRLVSGLLSASLTSIFLLTLLCQPAQCQPAAQETGDWIWHTKREQDNEIFLRSTLDVPGAIKSANVAATSDNGFELFVNGEKVLSGNAWERLEAADLSKKLQPGKNVFAVRATNAGGIAAFTLQADVVSNDGKKTRLVTNNKWKSNAESKPGWRDLDFDDSSWANAKSMGKVGDGSLPWSGAITPSSFGNAAVAIAGSFLPQAAENTTTLDGFKLEKLVHVPRTMGSWVSLTTAANGTLIASDQGGAGLYRITPSVNGSETKVEKLPVQLSGAQGLLWAFDALYVVVNGGSKSGLHKVTDSDGDGELDHAEHLMHVNGGGEHGPHAVILSPDKKSLFVCSGNHHKFARELSVAGSRPQLERRPFAATSLGCKRTRSWPVGAWRLDLQSRPERKGLGGLQHRIPKRIRHRFQR